MLQILSTPIQEPVNNFRFLSSVNPARENMPELKIVPVVVEGKNGRL